MRNVRLALVLTVAAGCNLGDVTPTAQPELRVLEREDDALVTVAPGALYIDGRARVLEGLGIGDVIVSNGAQPFLRKVVSIGSGGDRLTILTEPGSLTDAILDGEMHSSGDVFSRDIEPGSADDLVIAIDRLALDFNSTKLIEEGDIKVEIDRGLIRFRPALDVDLQIEDGSISHFHSIVRGELSASMGIKVTAGRAFSRSFSKTIWQSPSYRATQWVGIVPVVEVVRVSLILSGEVNARASGTAELGSASATASMEAGASYDHGRWAGISRPSLSLDARAPALQASVSAGASMRLGLKVDVKLYDLAGPNLTIGAYARTSIAAAGWTGRVGVDGTFGGSISVLGATLAAYDKQLFDIGRSF